MTFAPAAIERPMKKHILTQPALQRPTQELPWQADDLVEFPLLLTGFQATRLEDAARRRGLSPAQLIRQLIRQVSQ